MNIEEIRSKLTRHEGFLSQDPDNLSLIGEVADLRLQLGEFDRAQKLLTDALVKASGHPDLLFRLATVAMASGDTQETVNILQGLLDRGNYAPAIRYNLGYALLYERRYEEAKTQLDMLTDETTSLPEASLLRARVLHHLGALDEAISSATDYVTKQPDNAEALGILALLNLDSGELVTAKEWAEKSLELNQNNLESLVTLGSIALEDQNAEDAKGFFVHAVDRHPKSGRAWSGMGLTEMLDLDITTAIADLKTATEHMPNHIGTWHALAWCQILANDLSAAEKSLNMAMDIDRNFGETHGGLAVIAIMQGRKTEAEDIVKRAVRLDPTCFSGRFAQSLLLNQAGDAKAAQQIVQNILSHQFEGGGASLQETLARVMRERRVR